MTLAAVELCGFNVGSFEEKLIPGTGQSEANVLPWRLLDDLTLVVSADDKKLMSLADFVHRSATVHGVADFEIRDHIVSPKVRVPVSCRILCCVASPVSPPCVCVTLRLLTVAPQSRLRQPVERQIASSPPH